MQRAPHAFALATLAVLALAVPQVAATYESEVNDTCSQADALGSDGYFEGSMGAGDKDFFSRYADAGDYITVRLWQQTSGVIFHAVLHYPGSCADAAFSYKYTATSVGGIHESFSFLATTSGTWTVEVWTQVGTGYYDGDFWVKAPSSETCSTDSQPLVVDGVIGYFASCAVYNPGCPTGDCTYQVDLAASGVGLVTASFAGMSCSDVGGCTASMIVYWYPSYWDYCSIDPETIALNVAVTCTVTVLSF
jgi:hypothetical protein